VTALSTQRPVMTISAPRSRALAIGPALNLRENIIYKYNPVGKVVEKAVWSVFLTIWHCNLSVKLTKTRSFRPFSGDFAHWERVQEYI